MTKPIVGSGRKPKHQKEADLMREIQLEAAKYGCKLLRNNVGVGWVGEHQFFGGRMMITNPRPLHAGLGTGTSDLIGFTKKRTENGCVAVFTAIEVKTANGRLTLEQSDFLQAVKADGGLAVCAHSVEDALTVIKEATGWISDSE